MNSDIRISTAILTNKKIKRLIRRKGYEGFYNLISLWINTAIQCPEGALVGYDKDDVMDMANTSDEFFVDLLIELQLIGVNDKTYFLHDWKEHNPWAYGHKKRSENAKKAAEIRWRNEKKFTTVKN